MTDICTLCCPSEMSQPERDKKMTERVKAQVFSELGLACRPGAARIIRIALLAAVMASLFVGGAFALSRYFMNTAQTTAESVQGYWTELDEAGEILSQQKVVFPEAGMLFSFSGPDERPNIPEFRCFWLPESPDTGSTDAEGWTRYLGITGEHTDIPYIISASPVDTDGSYLVLNGDVSVIKEEYWGGCYVLQLSADYSNCTLVRPCEKAHYILIFDEQRGFLVTLGGSLDMETLEHIARELEIRDSGEQMPDKSMEASIGQIDIGRG